jgi:hypothetical protein
MKAKKYLILVLCLAVSGAFAQKKNFASLKQGFKKQESVDPHSLARKAYFEGRPTTASADVIAPKENIIPKKENFEAKIARYKTEGFVVAVSFYSAPIMTKMVPPPGATSTSTVQKGLSGSLPSMENDLRILAEEFTKRMNEEFNTDLFVLVDMSAIPTKKTMGTDSDDWGSTKYKTVFSYVISPEYDYNYSMNKINGDFVATASVTAMEYYSKKGKTKLNIVLGGNTVANFRLDHSDESLNDLKTVEELNSIVNPPSGEELSATLKKIQEEEGFDKVIQKLRK